MNLDWDFWFKWLVATTLGAVIGLAGDRIILETVGPAVGITNLHAVTNSIGELASFTSLHHILRHAMGGVVLGIAQGIVLRKQISGSGWWAFTTFLGWTSATIIGELIPLNQIPLTGLIDFERMMIGSLYGILGGVLQWMILRSQVRNAYRWVTTSILGWTIGTTLGGVVRLLFGIFPAVFILGLVGGAITGAGLIWLLRNPVSETHLGKVYEH